MFSDQRLKACQICPAGTFSGIGFANCSLCPPGTYSDANACGCSPCRSVISCLPFLSGSSTVGRLLSLCLVLTYFEILVVVNIRISMVKRSASLATLPLQPRMQSIAIRKLFVLLASPAMVTARQLAVLRDSTMTRVAPAVAKTALPRSIKIHLVSGLAFCFTRQTMTHYEGGAVLTRRCGVSLQP
jgi:hypothetical protein